MGLQAVYLKDYTDGFEADASLTRYFDVYRHRRLPQALGYCAPREVYRPPASSHESRNDEINESYVQQEGRCNGNQTVHSYRGRARPLE